MPENAAPGAARMEKTTPEQIELQRCLPLRHQPVIAYGTRFWWQRLALTPIEAEARGLPRPWSPGLRATLRRCETPEAGVLTEGFQRLWQSVQQKIVDETGRVPDIAAWACIAMVLAAVGDDAPGISFAAEAGKQKGDSGEPIVSSLRFQQLQSARSEEELVRRLRRILAILRGQPVSVVRLADDILLWFGERRRRQISTQPGQRLAFRWAQSYFDAVAHYKTADV